ncbi:hypothetical protein [Acetobacter sacchari]|uniref:hypothetical protein n=1 Tax=Acetobacter sacchari TaxID=2661687 RepID=UPI001FAEF3A8|nr:hypothetical protein [Acetobacter sacchari]
MDASRDSLSARRTSHSADARGNLQRWLPLVRIAIWSVVYFAFYMAQQIAELLAPLALILGVGWAALPHVVGAVSSSAGSVDAQAHDVMSHIADAIPHQIVVGTHILTPSGLIFDGIALMAVAAIGATLSAIAARSM